MKSQNTPKKAGKLAVKITDILSDLSEVKLGEQVNKLIADRKASNDAELAEMLDMGSDSMMFKGGLY